MSDGRRMGDLVCWRVMNQVAGHAETRVGSQVAGVVWLQVSDRVWGQVMSLVWDRVAEWVQEVGPCV